MMVTKTLCVCVFFTALMVAEGSSGSDQKKSPRDDMTGMLDTSRLRDLFNSGVYEAERVTRPKSGMGSGFGPVSHSGVRVTLEDSRWLVHKGDGYGISSQTVVVNEDHMSDKWEVKETKNFEGSKTVSDLVEAGGTNYNLLLDNCHHAARRMMKD